MLNLRSQRLSCGRYTNNTASISIPAMVTWFVFPQDSALTVKPTKRPSWPGGPSTSCHHHQVCINGGANLRPRHRKYVAPTPQEYRRALSQYKALRRRECRAGPGVGYPLHPIFQPLVGETESREEQQERQGGVVIG